ncbi:FAD-binding protein, partial [Chloroflexota bacterium]
MSRGVSSSEGAIGGLDNLHCALASELGASAVRRDHPLTRYAALRIGGDAELLVIAEDLDTLCKALDGARQHRVPCRVLGRASNVLISDAGVRGLVIVNRARAITFQADSVKAESGASLPTVARQCVDQ